ncbi:metallophosphoesterase [Pseudoalteromonas sp. PAB 2.2]|uniref:STAND family AAA ATPase n=1 Tax=Pseudoalteromonas sp. PAB 2.2 TaxID=1841508 RepID=UPI00094F7E88|nr:metallophosphoesterase [Pseudoalteromonas sp. PAB 2.2]
MSHSTRIFIVSDIHVKESDDKVINKLNKFVEYIHTYSKEGDVVLFVGDVAFSGKENEYFKVNSIFNELSNKIKILMCPGNHDHNFSINSAVRDILLTNIKNDYKNVKDDIILAMTAGQEDFFTFRDSHTSVSALENSPLAVKYRCHEKQRLSFQALNTAWCSEIKEVSGSLIFPEEKILSPDINSLNIIFFHHPLSWFEANNQKAIRNKIRNDFDIVITGHEHISDGFHFSKDDNNCLFIESISFDDPGMEKNGFLVLDVKEDSVIEEFLWCGDYFKKSKELVRSEIEMPKYISKNINGVELKSDFLNKILDLGTGFTHAEKESLDLDDVFVYPNIKQLGSIDSELKKLSSKDIASDISFSHLILMGEESIGKSTLIKKLFVDFLYDKKIPILLDGMSIKRVKKLKLDNLNKYISEQYIDVNFESLSSEKREKILLIDNFDFIKGSFNERCLIFSELFDVFDRVILCVSESFDIADLTISKEKYLTKFKKAEILRLGYKLRYELINKWNELKSGCQMDRGRLIAQNDISNKTINRLIGKNFIPSSPLFLLTMLQSLDSGDATDINTSSHGYYYQYLITSSMGASGIKKEQLEEIFSYVKELSFYFYNRQSNSEDYDSLWDFNSNFCIEYGLKIDAERRLEQLVRSKILYRSAEQNTYSFKYPYVYYFFIAKYFAETLDDPITTKLIDDLIEGLHVNKNMNILMFLTHHSKDKTVLDKIIKHARQHFNDIEKVSLDLDVMFLDQLVERLPPMIYELDKSDSQSYRLRKAEAQDNAEEAEDADDEDNTQGKSLEESNSEKDPEISTLIKDMNVTFKSLDLLGQLARTYYGSLKVGKKTELIEEAIAAPLRAMGYIFEEINKQPDEMISIIEKNIKSKVGDQEEMNPKEINTYARKALFDLLWLISTSFISKISTAIGNENLLPIIEKIAEKESTNAYYMLLLATKLDLGNKTSPDSIKKIIGKMSSNGLSKTIIQGFILNYLYMFDVKDEIVRKLCSIANIKYAHVHQQMNLDNSKIKELVNSATQSEKTIN